MIPTLELMRPNSVREALELLKSNSQNNRVLAGGTDVITGIQMGSRRFSDIEQLIDINQIPEMKKIEETDDQIIIGAGVTFSELMDDAIAQHKLPLLTKAASTVGNLQIRNRATISGNFINNAPCADSVPPLLVYDAAIKIESVNGDRIVDLEQFLTGTYKTLIQADELVTQIIIPKTATDLKGDFYKLGRRKSVAISRISLAVLIGLENSIVKEIKIAAGAVTPIGERFPELEAWAKGKNISDDLLKSLSIKMAEKIIKGNGLRWSSAYKVPVVQQAFYQLLKKVTD
ncbi:MAG: FAD-binding protein [Calditrichaeota bacterium]|nr:MAG: FAD-binding protein [Calditrichota bacterium]MBL1204729.1 FAD-binding protein [Calditrichota bacterium]NOG44557.1 FAD-binding protein [Calditrichota bacterium]